VVRAQRRLVTLMAAIAAVSSACGPHNGVELGVKQAGVDILYGNQASKAPPSAPPAQAAIVPTFPPFVAPVSGLLAVTPGAPAPTVPTPPAPPAACPDLDPFAVPDKPVTPYIPTPPAAGTYRYRVQGTSQQGSGPAVALPPETLRRVDAARFDTVPAASTTDFSYDVTETANNVTTTTTYRVENDGTSPGLKLAAITRQAADGTVSSFDPTPDILLMTIPAAQEAGAAHSAGTDPLSQMSMALDHRTVDRDIVNACGTPIQAWRVSITNGQTINPVTGANIGLTGTFEIAPQYGLVVSESVVLSGTDGTQAIAQKLVTTIDSISPVKDGR
jgi:hypothetical protein